MTTRATPPTAANRILPLDPPTHTDPDLELRRRGLPSVEWIESKLFDRSSAATLEFDQLVIRTAPVRHIREMITDLRALARELASRGVSRRDIAAEVLEHLRDARDGADDEDYGPPFGSPLADPPKVETARVPATPGPSLPDPAESPMGEAAPPWPADAGPLAEPIRSWYLPVKRVAEWAVALVLFVTALPLIVCLAFLVRLTSPGPAFYSFRRVGRGGREFRMFAFRTRIHAAAPDDRPTRIGQLLGVSGLEKLPQLLNVLRGEMALIGPAPARPELEEAYSGHLPGYAGRLRVRPGMVGLATLLLSGEDCSPSRWLAHDLDYVREVGPVMDLRIGICAVFTFLAALFQASFTLLLPRAKTR